MQGEVVLGLAGLERSEVEILQQDSSKLFTESNDSPMAPDDGVITRRRVTLKSKKNIPFIEWFFEKVITTSLRNDWLSDKERIFMLTGRAGQGKSTLCRKLFLLLTDQERGMEPSIQPNFDITMDSEMKEFFTEIQATTTYVQARKLSDHIGEHIENDSRKFFIIDGIDEITSVEVLQNIAKLISTQKQSVFLISSRTRQGDTLSTDDEIIYKDELDLRLNSVHVGSILDQNIATLGNLSKKEKSEMYKLLDEAEDLQSSRLEKLVKNNSPSLKRPADFHILKGDIKNGVQYYLGTTRWLLLRELNKNPERKKMVNLLSFTHLENGTFNFLDSRYFLSNKAENQTLHLEFIESMKTFNLIESTSSNEYYLDLTSPSSLGLLVCMYNGLQAQELIKKEFRKTLSEFKFSKPENPLWCNQLEVIFDQVIHTPLDKSGKKHSLYRFATSLLHSSQEEYKNEILDYLYSRLNPIEETLPFQERVETISQSNPITDLEEQVQLLLFATDVLHPVDEMELDSVGEDFNQKHRKIIELTIKRELSQFGNEQNALLWWDTRFEKWTKLFLHFAKIGPGLEFSELMAEKGEFKPLDMESEDYKSAYLNSWYPFMKEMHNFLQDESFEVINPYFKRFNSEVSRLNVSVRKRMFESLCYVLGTHLGGQSTIGKSKRMKSLMIDLFIHECRFPDNINIDALLDYGSLDVIASWWNLNGTLYSENTNKVIGYFLNNGMNEKTIYLPLDVHLEHHKTHADWPMRASKFLNQIVQRTDSAYIQSILKGVVMSSRLGHMNPVNQSGMYNSTFGADIGFYLFNYDDGDTILDKFLNNQKDLLELSSKNLHIPPAITIRKHKRWKRQTQLDGVYQLAKERLEVEANQSSIIRFAEFGTGSRNQIRESIHFWTKRGDFFVALLLAIRNGIPDLVSMLLICETNGTHYYEFKSKYIGNFIHRIPIQANFVNSPENRDDFENLLLLDSLESEEDKKLYRKNIRNVLRQKINSLKLTVQFPGEKWVGLEVRDWIDNNKTYPVTVPTSFADANIFHFGTNIYFLDNQKWILLKDFKKQPWRTLSLKENFGSEHEKVDVQKILGRNSFPLLENLVPAASAPVFFMGRYSGRTGKIDWIKSAFGTPEEFSSHRFLISQFDRNLQIEIEYKNPKGDWQGGNFRAFGINQYMISLERYNQEIVPKILESRTNAIFPARLRKIISHYCKRIKIHGISSPRNLHYLEKQEEQILGAWHVPIEYHDPSKISNDEHLGLIQHLYQDELLLSGISTKKENLNGKIRLWDNINLYKWSRLSASKFTGGIQGLKFRDSIAFDGSKLLNKPMIVATLDLELSPATCRSLMQLYDSLMLPKLPVESLEEVELGGAKLSSLNHAHSRIDSNFIDDNNNRINHFKYYVRPGYDNYIYGHKLKFEKDGDGVEVEGIAELTEEPFSGKDPRTVVSSFIPIIEHFKQNNSSASRGWVESLKESESLNNELKTTPQIHQQNSGMRTVRTWGIITDHGEIDDFKLKRIYQKLQSIEENLEEFKSGLHVKNGRTNLIDFIRTVHSTFSYIDWLPTYQKALLEIKKRTISLFERIEKEEQLQRGSISEGTTQDFDTMSAILEGLENQHKRFQERKIEQFKELLKLLQSEKSDVSKWKIELKKLADYFEIKAYEKYHEQVQMTLKNNPKLSFTERNDLLKYCEKRRGLKIRVLGLSKYDYPSELDSDWSEVLGELSTSESIEIGSLVRFDIKVRWRAGVKSLLLTNILLAHEELNAEGSLVKPLIPPGNIPAPLPENTWLGMYTDKAKVLDGHYSSFEIQMFVKPGKKYTFHPDFDVEIPIFNPDDYDSAMVGQMKQCKIEIRRDRRKGIFRYYVVDIKP